MWPAVSVNGVSKQFRLYHERYSTLKERILHLGRQSYEPFWALRDVSLDIHEGETVGLIGANGSGKTTLLNVIAGIIRPSSGTVRTEGRVAALLELGAGFHPDLTGRENVYMNASILGLSRKETNRHFDAIVSFAELEPFIDNQVKHYSSGMYVRLGFAVAVHVDPRILLVDEVLAVGDEAFQQKCFDKVRQFQKEGRTILFVSHALELVSALCHQAAFLDRGRLVEHGSPYEAIRAYKESLFGDLQAEPGMREERSTGDIRIISVSIRDAEGKERQVFQPGEDVEVVIDLEAPKPVEDPVVGVAIFNDRDLLVFGANTDLRQVPLGTVYGKVRLRFAFRRVPLIDGTYEITIGVHSRDHRIGYHWQERAYRFRAINPTPDVGFVHAPADISVEQL
jgi:ABC-2 type transport system ATP-binding protein